MKPLGLILALALVGCASTGVLQLSPDTYMISRQSGAGMFVNMPSLKADVIREANRFAAEKWKIVVPVSSETTFPTHGFPSFEYQFRLADPTNAPAK